MQAMASYGDPQDFSGRVAAACRRVNWAGVACSLALQAAFLAVLVSMGVVAISEKREKLTVLEVRPESQPPAAPAPPAPPKPEVEPVVRPQPKTDVIVPQPKLELQPNSQPIPVAVETPTPPAPAPAPAKAAPVLSSAGSGPISVANLSTNLLSGAPPSYPMGSRRKREQGMVVLRLVISPDGRVAEVSVSRSSGFPALDRAAVSAVRKWRWSPTMRDGRSVSITGLVQIPFVLKDE